MRGRSFTGQNDVTMGQDFFTKTVSNHRQSAELQIYDTAGAERFAKCLPQWFWRNVAVCLLCFDLSSDSAFDDLLNGWYQEAIDNLDESAEMVFVGLKSDLEYSQSVLDQAHAEAEDLGLVIYTTSAKTKANVSILLSYLATRCKAQDDERLVQECRVRLKADDERANTGGWCAC